MNETRFKNHSNYKSTQDETITKKELLEAIDWVRSTDTFKHTKEKCECDFDFCIEKILNKLNITK